MFDNTSKKRLEEVKQKETIESTQQNKKQ